ncbi:MAG: family transposase [Frankiales bacterium]|nr:family transposase [Frankiales bacterium]
MWSYGAALARHPAAHGVAVVQVSRLNRQVRRRHGKTDVVDAIAAARAVLSGEATATPKIHDGSVEALRVLKTLQGSANTSRTQALNQLRLALRELALHIAFLDEQLETSHTTKRPPGPAPHNRTKPPLDALEPGDV